MQWNITLEYNERHAESRICFQLLFFLKMSDGCKCKSPAVWAAYHHCRALKLSYVDC